MLRSPSKMAETRLDRSVRVCSVWIRAWTNTAMLDEFARYVGDNLSVKDVFRDAIIFYSKNYFKSDSIIVNRIFFLI